MTRMTCISSPYPFLFPQVPHSQKRLYPHLQVTQWLAPCDASPPASCPSSRATGISQAHRLARGDHDAAAVCCSSCQHSSPQRTASRCLPTEAWQEVSHAIAYRAVRETPRSSQQTSRTTRTRMTWRDSPIATSSYHPAMTIQEPARRRTGPRWCASTVGGSRVGWALVSSRAPGFGTLLVFACCAFELRIDGTDVNRAMELELHTLDSACRVIWFPLDSWLGTTLFWGHTATARDHNGRN